MKKTIRLVLLVLLLILVVIQFIPVDRSQPETDPDKGIASVHTISESSMMMIKNACFDCHSNQAKYPWYSYVAPVSFIIQDHVDEGREELNFSEWADYSAKKKAHKLEEVSEALREHWMPLEGYELLHSEAKLSAEEREMLAKEIDAIRNQIESTASN